MTEETVALAKLRLEEILTFFGVNTKVHAETSDDSLTLEVTEGSDGHLIGKQGETLAAIQQLLNAVVRANAQEPVYITVDIAGYKKARAEALTAKVKIVAEKVITSGQPEALDPMKPAERRIVHTALSEVSGVKTESSGEGYSRHVVISPSD